MPAFFLVLTLLLAVLDWLAVEFYWRKINFIAKPATLLVLIAWFTTTAGWEGSNLWFGLGLVFSLAGDIFLLFPSRLFLPGLVAFLLAHALYIIGFNQGPLPSTPLGLLAAVPIFILDFWLFRRLAASPTGRRMAGPVGVYMAAISLMLLSALACFFRPAWPLPAALAASLGACLFMLSDSVLAYNRFVAPTPHNDLVVMSTYHLAQLAIVSSLILY